MLDKVHLASDCALADDEIEGLEDLEAEFGQHSGHKVWIGVGEEGHVCHEAAAVEADDLLDKKEDREGVAESPACTLMSWTWASGNLLPLLVAH